MITKPLFRKNYLPFVSIVLVFILIGFVSSYLYNRYEKSQMVFKPSPFLRHIFTQLDSDPKLAVNKMNESTDGTESFRFDLIDKGGISLSNGKQVLPVTLTAEQLAALDKGEALQFKATSDSFFRSLDVSKSANPNWYFVTEFRPPSGSRPQYMMWITVSSLAVCTLISVALALFYQFSKYRERAYEALEVLSELKHGNLSARMPSKKFEELAPLVQAFNQMAGELERMVENMRKADHARRQLLQDLAHDLRTPLSSLKTFLETLKNSDKKLSEEKRHEVVSLCFSEVEYFGNLVEDLLFLAQITEPKYSVGTEEINLHERIAEQIHVFKTRYPKIRFEVSSSLNDQDTHVIGSTKLIDRLLRNAFENSTSFARNKIHVDLTLHNGQLQINILDDGPGFTPNALKEFGYKKASRVLFEDFDNKRISVGIGSVIMREIAQLHSGELRAENIPHQDQIIGSKVTITFNSGTYDSPVV